MTPGSNILEVAKKFGVALDNDSFETALSCLDAQCIYDTGESTFSGAQAICDMYEQNMLEGRKKFDRLEWGNCEVKQTADREVSVYFSDFLEHQGIAHNYQCIQHLHFDEAEFVVRIEHREIGDNRERLTAFKKQVGLL